MLWPRRSQTGMSFNGDTGRLAAGEPGFAYMDIAGLELTRQFGKRPDLLASRRIHTAGFVAYSFTATRKRTMWFAAQLPQLKFG